MNLAGNPLTDFTSIHITTGARLHFGLLSYDVQSGRKFGGAGLMIRQPGFRVTFEPASEFTICASKEARTRIQAFVERYLKSTGNRSEKEKVRISVESEIPAHAGFGSGTQLGMAVGQGLALLHGATDRSAIEIARSVERGLRSALGVHGFEQGGFLIDGGKAGADEVGELVDRLEFPREWRILLATRNALQGISGKQEKAAFECLPPLPTEQDSRLRSLLLNEMRPSIRKNSFDEFSRSLFEFGCAVGQRFASEQGGVFASPAAERLIEQMRKIGLQGVGQSSWGPTVFAICQSTTEAVHYQQILEGKSNWHDWQFHVTEPMNTGAVVIQSDSRT